MYEKHMWICAFMLSGAAHKCNMGQVDADHGDEVTPRRYREDCRGYAVKIEQIHDVDHVQ